MRWTDGGKLAARSHQPCLSLLVVVFHKWFPEEEQGILLASTAKEHLLFYL